MNIQENQNFVDSLWDQSIISTLMEYIKIPNKSPLFDKNWQQHGFMEDAVKLLTTWCHDHAIDDMKLEVIRLQNRTPVIFIEIPGTIDDTILLYGHYDKQPEMTGWADDLGPWKPVIKDDKLYGRGGADDGYAIFSSLTAIKSLRAQNIPHARCLILIEGCEESGSYDLPFYMEALKTRIANPSLVVCLDSGCGNYDQLWMTTSLRGIIGGVLHIDVLNQGVHSGVGSGVVPSCFMILRQLLDRIENKADGKILLKDLFVEIPSLRRQQADTMAEVLGDKLFEAFPFYKKTQATSDNIAELLLNRTWRPALSVTGCNGMPALENAGNVTLPSLKVKLSMRIPPTCDAATAISHLKSILELDPPFKANVTFEPQDVASGWNAPIESDWLIKANNQVSQNYFGKDSVYMGEGGTIPFMGMLGKEFPHAQFVITGVLGPNSNAHGPNEFLHIPTAKKLTACVAELIELHGIHCMKNSGL